MPLFRSWPPRALRLLTARIWAEAGELLVRLNPEMALPSIQEETRMLPV
jgi:hypothetical protein